MLFQFSRKTASLDKEVSLFSHSKLQPLPPPLPLTPLTPLSLLLSFFIVIAVIFVIIVAAVVVAIASFFMTRMFPHSAAQLAETV